MKLIGVRVDPPPSIWYEERMSAVRFVKRSVAMVVNDFGRYPMNTFLAVGDANGDSRKDIVVGARDGRMVWLENPGPGRESEVWKEHLIDPSVQVECGGSVADLTGSGLSDVIAAGDWRCDEIWWWENPGKNISWKKRLVLKTGRPKFHDTVIGDAFNDGSRALVATNQGREGGTAVWCLRIPDNPRQSPWSDARIVAEGLAEEVTGPDGTVLKLQPEEGIAVGDVDGDGRNEIVCGTHWFRQEKGAWRGFQFCRGYVTTKVAIADIDGDGQNEILLSEGDPCICGKTQGGKAAWFKPGKRTEDPWEEHLLEEGLLDGHTLCVADFTGNGLVDIVIGEIGVADDVRGYRIRPPRIYAFLNNGQGRFCRSVIDEGTGIHDGVLCDIDGDGRPDLVGRPLHGRERWRVHIYWTRAESSQGLSG